MVKKMRWLRNFVILLVFLSTFTVILPGKVQANIYSGNSNSNLPVVADKYAVYSLDALHILNTQAEDVAPRAYGQYWAVIVGINNYATVGPNLTYCVKDATDIRSSLIAEGWTSSHIQLLTDSSATKVGIQGAINSMRSAASSNDLCLFYFSGHGGNDGTNQYIVTYDSSPYNWNNDVSDIELDTWLSAITAKKVAMFDSCFSGGMAQAADMKTAGNAVIKSISKPLAIKQTTTGPASGFTKDLNKSGFVVLMACGKNETSLEIGALQHGLFTYYVLEGLVGPADTNGDGISAEELNTYATPRIVSYATSIGESQHPEIYDGIAGDVILSVPVYVPVSITTSSLVPGQGGTPYSATLQASGGTGSYTWSLASGSLPPGLTLNSGGTISGTPTTANTYTFTVQVNDGSTTAQKQLSIVVQNAALSVTTSSLSPGQVGSTYSATLQASGGTGSYSWSLASGSLPTGLNLTTGGTISGTPTTPNTFTFTVRVSDGSTTASKQLSILINPAAPSVTTNSASGISSSAATLNGSITNLNGNSSATLSFEYGLSGSYGSTVTATPSSLTTTGAFSAQVLDLTPNKTYHFRAAGLGTASNPGYGVDKTFTTAVLPLTVTTTGSDNISSTTAKINGNLVSLGPNNTHANVYFEYGTSLPSGVYTPVQVLTTAGTFSASACGLQQGTAYQFRAVAQSGGHAANPVTGTNLAFTTSASTPFVVSTYQPTSSAVDSAALYGNLDSMGGNPSVNVSFQWGTSPTPAALTSETASQALNTQGSFTATLSGIGNPSAVALYSIWGSSANDIFVVGYGGTILHFNGSTWETMDSGTTSAIKSVWGRSGSDVFAVGYSGTILHYNGTTWQTMSSGTTNHLEGVWGSSGNEVIAVGWAGTVLRYNGSTWNAMTAPYYGYHSIWGSSANDIFAVGTDGTNSVIAHYNGTAWTSMSLPAGTSSTLESVWGSSGSDVFAVGWSGTVLRYNGTAWSLMSPGTSISLYGIGGRATNDVIAVGATGTILKYNGTAWTAMTSGFSDYVLKTWGDTANNVYAVGNYGTILRYNGSTWSTVKQEAPIYYCRAKATVGTNSVYGDIISFRTKVEHDATLTFKVSAATDDIRARRYTYGGSSWYAVDAGATRRTAGNYDYNQYNTGSGFRFQNVTIPPGKTVKSARLKFTAYDTISYTAVNTIIRGQLAANPPTFAGSYADYIDANRPRTAAATHWDSIPAWTANSVYYSDDIKGVVQELINQPAWASGNSMVIFWEDDGSTGWSLGTRAPARSTYPYGADPTKALELEITLDDYANTATYQVSAANDDIRALLYESSWIFQTDANWRSAGDFRPDHEAQSIGSGFRFRNVAIPQGAQVIYANLELTAGIGNVGTVARTKVHGQAIDNALAFTGMLDDYFTNRPRTSAEVLWDDLPTWVADTVYTSPNISNIIKEITGRANWNSGNSLVLFWDDGDYWNAPRGGASAIRSSYPYVLNSSGAARLDITYIGTPSVSTSTASVTGNSATLNGAIDTLGSAPSGTASFILGKTTGTYTLEALPLNQMTTAGSFSSSVSGLSPATTYFYKAKLTCRNGIFLGDELSFTTGAATVTQPTISNGIPATTGNTATLRGNLSSPGTAPWVIISFLWGPAPGALNTETVGQTICGTGQLNYVLTNLDSTTDYFYRIKAQGQGQPVFTDEAKFTTGGGTGTYGYMGIGTDNPQRPLHLLGNACLFERAQDSAGFIIKRTSANRWVFGVDEDPQSQFVIKSYPEGSPATVRMSIDLLGNISIPGALSKGSGTFKIDHPLDPANKYLSHSFVESPDMLNVYNGSAVLDGEGRAIIELPFYFEALNRDYSYQLEGVGSYAPLYIEQEIRDNRFTVSGGRPGMKVSWQVVGIRQDPFASAHPVIVEQEKSANE